MTVRDLRLAIRILARRPAFLVTTVLILGVGLSAAVATWAVVDRVLLRPLPYPEADRLVYISGVLPGDSGPGASLSYRDLADLGARATSLAATAGLADERPVEVLGDAGPHAARVNFVNTAYFDLVGARAARGRLLDARDERTPGAHPVAVVSHGFWQAHLGGRPDVIGHPLPIGDERFTVVGVMAPEFRDVAFEAGARPTEIWLSSMMSLPTYGPAFLSSRSARILNGLGRLADGVTLAQARAEVDAIARALEREFPDTNRQVGLHIEQLDRWLFRDARGPFLVALTGALALLAAAALNVTGLLVVRLTERSRDLVVRRALGASTARLVGPAAAEAVVLAGLAAAVGGLGAPVIIGLVRANAPYLFPRLQEIAFDARAAAALAALAALAAVALTAASLLLVRWRGPLGAGASRAVTADRLTVRLQRGLVTVEVALAVVLLTGSVLVVGSLTALGRAPLGFTPDRLMTTALELRGERYADPARVVTFGRDLVDTMRREPGVEQAFVWGPGRPGHDTWISYLLPEREAASQDPPRIMVWRHHISAGALADAGIRLLAGREFQPADRDASPLAAIVSESTARRFWPDGNPLGQRFTLVTSASPRPWFQVIGVAADAAHRRRTYSLRLPEYDYYQFFDQRPERSVTLVTRATPPPDAMAAAIRRAVAAVDPALPIREIRTMADHLAEEEQAFRFSATLLAGFAALTFALSAAGLHGLVGYVLVLRRRELALRSALGATRGRLFRSLAVHGLRPALAGIVVGLAAAWLVADLPGSLLYGVDPRDPVTYVLAAGSMLAIVAAATALAAAGIRGVDPMRALRD